MKFSKKCCEYFPKMAHKFKWHSFEEGGKKVYVMPCIDDLRINHCPSCGKEVRDIELRDEK